MTHARLADIEAAIARDESTNPDAYYEYQGTIDESHQRRQLAHDVIETLPTMRDRAFLAPDGKWVTEPEHCARCWANPDTDVDEIPVSRIPAAAHRGPRTNLPTGGPAVNYGAAGI